MIEYKLYYQASVFVDSSEISPKPEYITTILDEFKDFGFIPSTFQEISGLGNQIRLSLQTSNSEWLIEFGTNRVDIMQNAIDSNGSNLSNELVFAEKAVEIYSKIHKLFPKNSKRMALSSAALLEEISTERLEALYLKLNNPIPTYQTNKPSEWNNRVSTIIKKEINGSEVDVNYISQINRLKGNIKIAGSNELVPIDRIEIKLDLNTHQNIVDYRFNLENVVEFLNLIAVDHENLISEIIDFLRNE